MVYRVELVCETMNENINNFLYLSQCVYIIPTETHSLQSRFFT